MYIFELYMLFSFFTNKMHRSDMEISLLVLVYADTFFLWSLCCPYYSAMPKCSDPQVSWLKQIVHGKSKSLMAKANHSQQNQKTSWRK
jgi:hypothetical protein